MMTSTIATLAGAVETLQSELGEHRERLGKAVQNAVQLKEAATQQAEEFQQELDRLDVLLAQVTSSRPVRRKKSTAKGNGLRKSVLHLEARPRKGKKLNLKKGKKKGRKSSAIQARLTGQKPLRNMIALQLNGVSGALSVTDVTSALLGRGYVSGSKNFKSVVANALYTMMQGGLVTRTPKGYLLTSKGRKTLLGL